MNPKVSVIVPVFNAGKSLEKCLISLKNQSLREMEIIIVLDCPTDGSDLVVDAFAKNDGRIIVIRNTENINIGCSRNKGLEVAQGEYVGFMDHDDFCKFDMFEKLYNHAVSTYADVVISNYCVKNDEIEKIYSFPITDNTEFKDELLSAVIGGRYSDSYCSFNNVNPIWIEIVKRDLILKNKIKFIDNRELPFEDVLFNVDIYYFAQRISYLSETFYYHVVTGDNSFGKYSYCSSEKIFKFINYLSNSLELKDVKDKYSVELAECVLTRLYTSFRKELRMKGVRKAIRFVRTIKHNNRIQQLLLGVKQNGSFIVPLALTKRLFYCLIRL